MSWSPADLVTTRYLQQARRSAERKSKQNLSVAKETRHDLPEAPYHAEQDRCQSTRDPLEALPHNLVNSVCELASSQGWTLQSLRRIWSCGFSPESLAGLMRGIPPSMQTCVAQAVKAWTNITKTVRSDKKIDATTYHMKDRHRNATHMEESIEMNLSNGAKLVSVAPEREPTLKMAFDALTQIRSDFVLNQPLAELLDMHEDVLRERIRGNALDLPFTELDAVCLFLHFLLRDCPVPGVPQTRSLRLITGTKELRRGKLVCWSSIVLNDDDAQAVEASRTLLSP